jgi:uncharacterized protein YjbI with pentapeptide repeats
MLKSKHPKFKSFLSRLLTKSSGLSAWESGVTLLFSPRWQKIIMTGLGVVLLISTFEIAKLDWNEIKSILLSFGTSLDLSKNWAVLMGVIVTITFSWLNVKVARSNLKLTEEKIVTERLAKAFEQLESGHSTVRLGAVYTLERIAAESPIESQTILEILASFIRSNASAQKAHHQPLKPEAQAALMAIVNLTKTQNRQKRHAIRTIDTSNLYLVKATLTNVDLQGINLSKADLRDSDLDGANLSNAVLIEADLSGAYLGEVILRNTNLSKSKFEQVNSLARQTKQADFTNAVLMEASLKQAKLYRACFVNVDLRSAILWEANLREANFRNAVLSLADFTGANLSKADFTNAILVNTILDGADLYQAKFTNAKISNLESIKRAKNWEDAEYDPAVRDELRLSPL